MSFLINESVHLILTLTIAGFFYWKFRDWRLILTALIFGFFIDVDHLFDYFAYFGLRFSLVDFLNVATYMMPAGRVYVLFHGWEYLLSLWTIGVWGERRFKLKNLRWLICLTYLGHLIWDMITVSTHPLAYSIIYRLLNNFSLESFDKI